MHNKNIEELNNYEDAHEINEKNTDINDTCYGRLRVQKNHKICKERIKEGCK